MAATPTAGVAALSVVAFATFRAQQRFWPGDLARRGDAIAAAGRDE